VFANRLTATALFCLSWLL